MEEVPKTEKPISPEEFFANKTEVYRVTKDNFFKLVKQRNPTMDEDKILQAKGINFEMNGKVVILLRTDKYPEQYLPYLETHEKWEAYIARRDGYNLWDKSVREYQKDKQLKLDDENTQQFFKELEIYNYDFRHEYAIYKEYQQALGDGKLDEYHTWFMELRKKEKEETTSEANLKLIENDTKIRQSIYSKLKENTKHSFTRN